MNHSTEERDTGVTLANVFEERAENLSRAELTNWTAQTERDRTILSKLKGTGAKLLIGPRGSGKSTLLRRAYFELLEKQDVLPVYVNYSRSLWLEPMFHSQANAPQVFRQWVLMKILSAIDVSLRDSGSVAPKTLEEKMVKAHEYIRQLEIGNYHADSHFQLAPSDLVAELETLLSHIGGKRIVLLLDDAAHAFSLEQQRDFFEIFRELRSRHISAKAAVYPGITSYSPSFNVGHEAEMLEAWYRPDDDNYLDLMRSMVQRRLPETMSDALRSQEEIVDLLALASFGLPRGFLNMLSQLLPIDEPNVVPSKPTRSAALQAIHDHAESVRGVFRALSVKLPRFKNYIEVGQEIETAITNTIQAFNKKRSIRNKAVIIAIKEPLSPKLNRIVQFYEYAGLVRRVGSVSRGVKGVFQRFALHYAILIEENSLNLGRSYALSDLVSALRTRDSHAFVRTSQNNIFDEMLEGKCTLNLPPCQECGTDRVNEEQKFCMNCGAELASASLYTELLKSSIDNLPLTSSKIEGIKQHTTIRTVEDILNDDERAIRKVPYIGEVWSKRIRNYAEEFVSV